MSFAYTPMTEEQAEKARQFPLLEPGIYEFRVIEASSGRSSSGNSMITLKLAIRDAEGITFNILDYLVATEKMAWKTRHFANSVGLDKEYENGSFNETLCQGKQGKAQVIHQAGKARPNGGYYHDKSAIEDYVMNDLGQSKSQLDEFQDDVLTDIPF